LAKFQSMRTAYSLMSLILLHGGSPIPAALVKSGEVVLAYGEAGLLKSWLWSGDESMVTQYEIAVAR